MEGFVVGCFGEFVYLVGLLFHNQLGEIIKLGMFSSTLDAAAHFGGEVGGAGGDVGKDAG